MNNAFSKWYSYFFKTIFIRFLKVLTIHLNSQWMLNLTILHKINIKIFGGLYFCEYCQFSISQCVTHFDWQSLIFSLVIKRLYELRYSILWKQITIQLFSIYWFIFWCLTPLSAISWRTVLVVEEARVPGENHWPWASNW